MELLINRNQDQLMSAMPWVISYKNKLEYLNNWWTKISLIGKINSYSLDTMIFSDMQSTKEKLSELQRNLVRSLLIEEVKKSILDSTSKAQVAIDILIRNLFERTADVGFLATDSDIRNFLKMEEASDANRELLSKRLEEYVKKYSVYHDIIITDIHGNVQIKLDMKNPVVSSSDPFIKETLSSTNEYIENYRYTDLKPNQEKSLFYSCKITENSNKGSRVLGVLCLFFKLKDEMESIFKHLHVSDSKNILMLTSSDGKIISSNQRSLPSSFSFKPNLHPELVTIGGTSYITITVNTKGYQGFYGLGWYARSMLPLHDAFSFYDLMPESSQKNACELLPSSSLFSDALKQIHHNSQDVNEDLKLIILNGIITAARAQAAEFVPVLEEIKKISDITATVFSESIQRLQNTVLSSWLTGVRTVAELAVDIMDRNLYERANDCRWWALTTSFRQLLNKEMLNKEEQNSLSSILAYINQLYTVYFNLYLYDSKGKILAVSNPGQSWMVGTYVNDESGARETLHISDSQKYAVSAFVTTPYYQNRPTYIYNASITSLDHSGADGHVIGGIGIVFDCEPQFENMLTDTLPKNEHGHVVEGCFGLFVTRDGFVISSTEYSPVQVGETLTLNEKSLLDVDNGKSLTCSLTYNKKQYVIGVSASKGYREYKTTGDYRNDVLAVIFLPQ